jgi:hypothetical protein
VTKRSCREPPFRRLFNHKTDFAFNHSD